MSDDLDKILAELKEMKKELREAREKTEKAEQEAMQKLSVFQNNEEGDPEPDGRASGEQEEPAPEKPGEEPVKPRKRVIEAPSSIGDEPEQQPKSPIERLEEHKEGGAKLDRMLEIVATRGRAKRSEIAREMGITPQEVERLGEILAKHGIIRMRYPFFGEPVLEIVKKG